MKYIRYFVFFIQLNALIFSFGFSLNEPAFSRTYEEEYARCKAGNNKMAADIKQYLTPENNEGTIINMQRILLGIKAQIDSIDIHCQSWKEYKVYKDQLFVQYRDTENICKQVASNPILCRPYVDFKVSTVGYDGSLMQAGAPQPPAQVGQVAGKTSTAVSSVAKPNTGNAAEDEYAYGTALMNSGKYASAAKVFHDNYKNHGDETQTGRGIDSLFGLAEAMLKLGYLPASCEAMTEALRVYTNRLTADQKAKISSIQRSANCSPTSFTYVSGQIALAETEATESEQAKGAKAISTVAETRLPKPTLFVSHSVKLGGGCLQFDNGKLEQFDKDASTNRWSVETHFVNSCPYAINVVAGRSTGYATASPIMGGVDGFSLGVKWPDGFKWPQLPFTYQSPTIPNNYEFNIAPNGHGFDQVIVWPDQNEEEIHVDYRSAYCQAEIVTNKETRYNTLFHNLTMMEGDGEPFPFACVSWSWGDVERAKGK